MNFKNLSTKNVSIKNLSAEQKMIALGVIFIVAALTVFFLNSTGLRSKLQLFGGKEAPLVIVYYSEDKVHLPEPINDAVSAASYYEFQIRDLISRLNELDKEKKLKEQEKDGVKALSKVIDGLNKVSNFDGISTQFYQYRIVNEGKVAVENLEFELPGSGYAEIHKKGHDTVSGLNSAKSTYRYNVFRPGEVITIDYWTNSSFSRPDHITGLYKKGVVIVKPLNPASATVEPKGKKRD